MDRAYMTPYENELYDAHVRIGHLTLEVIGLRDEIARFKPVNLRQLRHAFETYNIEKLLISLLDDDSGNVRLQIREMLGMNIQQMEVMI